MRLAGGSIGGRVARAARVEPGVGLDASGHVTPVLEYTPGRLER